MLVQPARDETLTRGDLKRLRKEAPKEPLVARMQRVARMKQPDKGDADKKRVIGKPFVKGQVANPKGRPKDDIAALARCYGVEALTTLVRMLVVEKYAVQAATVLLDRGYGKPKQESEHNINVSIKADQLSDDDLARLVHRAAVKTIEHHATPMQHGDVTDVDAVDISKG